MNEILKTNIVALGTIKGLYNRLDKGIMSTQLSVKDLLSIHSIDKEVNRDLGYHRLPSLLKYFESMENQIGVFLPSIVLSFRGDPSEYYNVSQLSLQIPPNQKLTVIDGQHRIKGMEQFISKADVDEHLKEKLLNSFVTVQIYFGLSREDERKLFTDINTNAKRVSRSLITNYDTRDIHNSLVRELYHASNALRTVKVEFNKSRIVRPNNDIFITSVRLKKFINLILFGKESSGQKNEIQIKNQYDELFAFLFKLFDVLLSALPSNPGDVRKYVLGHEALQNAIALYIYDSLIIDNEREIKWLETWEGEIEQLGSIDWSVKNREWHPFMMTNRKNTPYEYQSFIETTTPDLKEIIIKHLI